MLLVTHFRAEGPELSLSDLPKVTQFLRGKHRMNWILNLISDLILFHRISYFS